MWSDRSLLLLVGLLVRQNGSQPLKRGSLALHGALALFSVGLRHVIVTAGHPSTVWIRDHALLVVFLAACGAALARALSGG